MNRIITLTTDFGTGDGYVGTMKGVILRINPQATIVDITHEIAPQSIEQGAFLFAASARYFPANAIHVLVIDPGVGSTRRPIAVKMGETTYIAPDNGILPLAIFGQHGYVAPDYGDLPSRIDLLRFVSSLLGSDRLVSKMVHLNKPEYWLPSVSHTFHGRDIFAPCAAHLSLGLPLEAVGEPIRDWQWNTSGGHAVRVRDSVYGRVIHIDHFGTLVTNIQDELVRGMDHAKMVFNVRGHRIPGLKQTYSEVAIGQVLALVGSTGHIEIAVRDGSAVRDLQIRLGEAVVVTLEP
jgi:S-adenosylmethionine hydrolase